LEIVLIINNNTNGTAGSKKRSCRFGKTRWNRMKIDTPMKIGKVLECCGATNVGDECPEDECCGATNVGDECPEDECLRRRDNRNTIVITGKM
jgi:hypothetical protein